jgi:NIMA (never in mitosis gene a)-related kinase
MGLDDFEVIKKLGEGAFSSVWLVRRRSDNENYAMKKIKICSLTQREKENALNEVRILASIESPYIIGYKEAFLDEDSLTFHIIMEHAKGGDLAQKIWQYKVSNITMPEAMIWKYFL